MKSNLIKTMALGLAVTAMFGCQKEVIAPDTMEKLPYDQIIQQGIGTEDGALVFQSESEMYASLERISSMKPNERFVFESKHNFKSLGRIYYEVQEAEAMHEQVVFRGVDPNLTVDQYEAMGYYYTRTPLFVELQEKGVLVEEIEADRSRSFHLSVDNPGFINVLNEEGIVFAGNKKYVFENKSMKIFDKVSNTLLHQVSSEPGIESVSDWRQESAWHFDGSNKRYNYEVYGTCITSSPTSSSGLIESTFYVEAEAENRKWGIWASRSSYMPIYSFSGSWTADYRASKVPYSSGPLNPVYLNDNDHQSPFSWHSTTDPYGQTNHFIRYFRPNGSWALPGWYISMPFDVHYTMTFTFAGGPSGFTHTLSL